MKTPRKARVYYRKGENLLDHKKRNKNGFCPEADHLLPDDIQVLNTIREITGRGNDAEVRKKRDGTLAVYEIKRNMVTVK